MDIKKKIYLVTFFILAFICAVIFCCTSRNNVYDNGCGADKLRDELTNAQAAQRDEATAIRETKQSINRSEAAVTNSQERIESSEQTNREIADTHRKDTEIIDECEQILARVRERTATKNWQFWETKKYCRHRYMLGSGICNRKVMKKYAKICNREINKDLKRGINYDMYPLYWTNQ